MNWKTRIYFYSLPTGTHHGEAHKKLITKNDHKARISSENKNVLQNY